MSTVTSDCRSEEGITIGLIDALVSICRVLAKRDLQPDQVVETLKDLGSDEDFDQVLNAVSDATVKSMRGK